MYPVLLIAFDRPQKGAKLLQILAHHEGPLFLFRDGGGNPQHHKEYADLFQSVAACRPAGSTSILMPEKNLGQRDGPWAALQWFFSQNPAGIVLEEDLEIAPGMLETYSKGLAAFEENKEVFALGAAPPRKTKPPGPHPWNPSPLFLVWGWASWSDRILPCNIPNALWQKRGKKLLEPFKTWAAKKYLELEMELLAKNPGYCWSYYLQLEALEKKAITLIPSHKMTRNTGIDPGALRSKTGNDESPDEVECGKLALLNPGINPTNSLWQKQTELAKFPRWTSSIRRMIGLGTKAKRLCRKTKEWLRH